MQLKITDLFKDTGHNFSYVTRDADQKKLMERMKEFPVLEEYVKDLDDFGVASMNYLDYFLTRLTKTCSQNGINIV